MTTYHRRKGAFHNRMTADYLAEQLADDGIDVQPQRNPDVGDVRGVKVHGQRVAVECKNTAKPILAQALAEAETERVNLGALAGVVVAKRHGKGQPGDQLVYMTLRDFAAILSGHREQEK